MDERLEPGVTGRRGVLSALRRIEDPARSDDPRVRTLVSSLATLDVAPAPDPEFRSELRAQPVAVTPRIIAESRESAEAERAADTASPSTERARRRRLGRPIAIAASVAAAFVLLFGGALWMSQKALPGDALYGLKRASENVRLDLAGSGTDRGQLYLSLAQTRVEEARALLGRSDALAGGGTLAGGRLSPGTASLITSTLNTADSELADGSEQLSRQAVRSHSGAPLAIMTNWAPGQLSRLRQLAVALPSGPLQNRAKSSEQLTSSALTRARTLAPKLDCSCLQHAASDKLGPVPCGTCTAPSSPAGTTPGPVTSPAPSIARPSRPSATVPGAGSNGRNAPRSAPALPTPGLPTRPVPTSAGKLTIPLPSTLPTTLPSTLPTKLPTKLPTTLPVKPPVSVTSCGISVGLGPVGIGVGACPTTP